MELLNLSSLQTIDAAVAGARCNVRARSRTRASACVHCASAQLYTHGTQRQSYADTPVNGRAVTICIDRQRYRCRACGRTFFEPIDDLDCKRRATRRLVDYVERNSLSQPFLRIARDVGLDDKTIRSIFNDYTGRMAGDVRSETPRFLGIEDSAGHGPSGDFVIDVEQATLYDLLPGRNVEALASWFRNLPDAGRVQWVATGCSGAYRGIIQAALPRARIVIDKYHALRMADEALDTARRTLRRTLPKADRLRLRGDRRVLLTPGEALAAADADQLAQWHHRYPLLRGTWEMKETFRAIWNPSRSSAEAALDYQRWRKGVRGRAGRYFGDLVRIMDSRNADFMAWFESPMPENYTVSARSVLATIVASMARMGHGYSFEVTRAKMLLGSTARAASSPCAGVMLADVTAAAEPGIVEPAERMPLANPATQHLHAPRVDIPHEALRGAVQARVSETTTSVRLPPKHA